jgi:Fibronectin type III domain
MPCAYLTEMGAAMKCGRLHRILPSAALFALLSSSAFAANVTLVWDPNEESDVAGYIVKYGEQPNEYRYQVDAGMATSVKLQGLVTGRTYYFAVQAYGTDGSKSAMSPELPFVVGTSSQQSTGGTAQFTVTPDADGRLTSQVLTWTSVTGAQAYYLRVGTASGAKDAVDSGEIQTTSYTLPALPFDRTYFARVFTKVAGAWTYSEISFRVAKISSPARMIAPVDGKANVTSADVFRWEAVPHAQAYYFQVGTRSGGRDIIDSGETSRTWWTTPSLPAGRRLYARISTKLEGKWYANDIEFTSAAKSVLVYPYNTASDTSAYETFVWTGVTDAQAYRLYVGTAPGAGDIVDTGETKSTSFQVNGLQPGQTLHARVYTLLKGVWEVDSVTFTTSLSARFTKPMAGDGSDLGQGIQWTTILGADSYYLRVGSAPGQKDFLDSGEVVRNDYDTPSLPAGKEVFARIYTKYAGQWRQRDTSLTLAGAALTSPSPDLAGTVKVDPLAQLFTWTTISNAEAYYLYIGTEPGAKNLLDTGEIQGNSYLVKNLPVGRRIYVSIWTKANGVWNGTSSTFVTK